MNRQMRQEGANLVCTQFGRMAFVMRQDKPSDPTDVRFLRSETHMIEPQHGTYLVEQLNFACIKALLCYGAMYRFRQGSVLSFAHRVFSGPSSRRLAFYAGNI